MRFEICLFKIIATSSRGQQVKGICNYSAHYVHPKKYAVVSRIVVCCCGQVLIVLSFRITSLSTGQSHDSPHYNDVIMTTIASQITSLTVVYSIVYSDADQRKYQSSASLAFVWGIHRDRWIPRTKGQLRGKCFHLMTSSWYASGRSCLTFVNESKASTKRSW